MATPTVTKSLRLSVPEAERWERYAQEHGLTFAGLVRLAVEAYMEAGASR